MSRVKSPPAKRSPRRAELFGAATRASRRLSTAAVLLHGAVAGQLGLNATDHKTLDLLLLRGPLTAGDLAERMGLTTAAMTTAIDRLAAQGLVRREKDPDDRRRVIVVPTVSSSHEQRVRAIFGPLVAEYHALLDNYSNDELRLIIDYGERASAISEQHAMRLQGVVESARHPRAGPER